VRTIRWSERDGIIPTPARTAGGHRLHTQVNLNRHAFIRRAGELRFALGGLRGLLRRADDPERSCDEVDNIARSHPAAVRSRIDPLRT